MRRKIGDDENGKKMKVSENVTSNFDFRLFEAELIVCAQTWTQSAVFARECPDRIAVFSSFGNRSYLEIHQNANRIANALLAQGLKAGDGIALMSRNRPEFLEILMAAMRIGLRLTPVNTHLTAPEVAYIVSDAQARVFFIETELEQNLAFDQCEILLPLTIFIGKPNDTGINYNNLLASTNADLPTQLTAGTLMMYTSGTTGRPKGVFRDVPETFEPQYAGSIANYLPGDVSLCCGPAYHAAPLLIDLRWPLVSGVPIVMLEKWDSVSVLELIETHRVSHAHMVPIMFQRLLSLDSSIRKNYDLSSLRFLVHGAAPCPVSVKRAMIDWLGPVLIEYYGATEGGNGINVGSEDWLRKPGTVGRLDAALGHRIFDDEGKQVDPGTVGTIFFKAPETGQFAYFGDTEKTAAAYKNGYFTLGDLGYVDEENFLFLTGRTAECIVSGGVNVYPQEIDNVLQQHFAVADVCTIGVPDDTWGERVVSLVVLKNGHQQSDALAVDIIAYASKSLAGFKRPRTILFETELPRTATGKLLRQLVRQRFWSNQEKSI